MPVGLSRCFFNILYFDIYMYVHSVTCVYRNVACVLLERSTFTKQKVLSGLCNAG